MLSLPRKITELRAALSTLVGDPRTPRLRDELRRRLHGLYTLTKSYALPHLAEGLREAMVHLDAVRGAQCSPPRPRDPLGPRRCAASPGPERCTRATTRVSAIERGKQRATARELTLGDAKYGAGLHGGARCAEGFRSHAHDALGAWSSKWFQRWVADGSAGGPPRKQTLQGFQSVPLPAPTRRPTLNSIRVGSRLPPQPRNVPIGVLIVGSSVLEAQVRGLLPTTSEVVAVRTLVDAVVSTKDNAPDVVVAECAAPARGLELVATLRSDPLTDFLPVLLVASPEDGVTEAQGFAKGAAIVLQQPVEGALLRDAIERAAQGLASGQSPPPGFSDLTLEELTRTLQEEIRRGILTAAGPALVDLACRRGPRKPSVGCDLASHCAGTRCRGGENQRQSAV